MLLIVPASKQVIYEYCLLELNEQYDKTDTTCDLYSTNPNWQWYAVNNNATQFFISDTTGTPTGNAGWTFIDVYYNQSNTSGTPNTTVVRSGLSYQSVGSTRIWTMPDSAGSTAGAFSSPTLSPVTLGFR